MPHTVLGWDIGGAHLKAALIDEQGTVIQIYLEACPLWKGLEYLQQAVQKILKALPIAPDRHAITMTGELVDLFNSRDEGVAQIIQAMQSYLPKQTPMIYAGGKGFFSANDVKEKHYSAIASANWLASASLSASQINSGLFIDIGSTTTDILVCDKGKVQTQAFSDYQRLQSQELVYTGIVRTAVMAVTQTGFFKGQAVGLMAEYFATMADVYRLTGELNEAHDHTETADGDEKTPLASAKRLSRMIGYEFEAQDLAYWQQFAAYLKSQQKQHIKTACQRQLSRLSVDENTCIVGAGIGRFLAQQIAVDLGLIYQDFNQLVKTELLDSPLEIADCAPAVAVACLSQQLTTDF